ncbi:glycosyltransferase [Roseibium alexandrii]|uniref:Spore coat protein SA n=1 Tax=Roseibium alexandrii TaxID=388408 RepID=A0A0M7ARF1_9HYPH|nr:glycosyltransferase [Roseibium alexandrii]CTQ77479.1 Spore coat protein SA [Roseibium alexandrii]
MRRSVLFVQPKLPGQFRRQIATALTDPKTDVLLISNASFGGSDVPKGAIHEFYGNPSPKGQLDPLCAEFNTAIATAAEVEKAALKLKLRGYTPDTIIAYYGYGESLFLRGMFPNTRIVTFFEYFYGLKDGAMNFDPEFRQPEAEILRRSKARNSVALLALHDCDEGIVPTKWQLSRMPEEYRHKIKIVPDEIDQDLNKPNPNAILRIAGREFSRKDQIVSYCARALEPTRGIHIFMRSLPRLMKEAPEAHVVIVGKPSTAYDPPLPNGEAYIDKYLSEIKDKIDLKRLHRVGWLEREDLTALFQVSSCHVYLTTPFVASWSLREALACQTPIVASNTAPVREFVEHGKNGYLVDFFDYNRIAETVSATLHQRRQPG